MKWQYWNISAVDLEQYNFRLNQPELSDDYGHSIQGDYFQGHQAIYQYAYDVIKGIRPAGRSEIAACERFIFDLNREDVVFDHEEVDFVYLVTNQLRHPKGPIAGKPFYIMPWMGFILGQIYGWFYTDKARETLRGERRFIKSFTAVARGNSKTVLGAAAAIVMMLTTQNGAPVATTSATVQKQSRLAFEDISRMIKTASPSIKKRFRCLQNEIRSGSNDGKIFPTSSESETLDGIRITFALVDEIHAHPDSKIVDVLSTGMQSSKDPHLMMITTAGVDTQSYGREVMDYADEIAQNKANNDRFLSVVYKVDKEHEDDWDNETRWFHANPALNHAVSLEALRAAFAEATRTPKARASFMTKHLNVWVDFDEDNFIESGELLACKSEETDINNFKGKPCYLGLDLAGVSDLSSLVYIFPDDNGGIDVFQRSYLPEVAIHKVKPSIQDRYYTAHQNGELILTIGEVTDYEYIKSDIVKAYEDFEIKAFSIDGASGGVRFANELEEVGIEAVGVSQGKGLSESAVLLQSLVKSKKFKYSSDLLEWCFTNALQKEDMHGNIIVVRPKNDLTKKIDICIATLIGLSQTILNDIKTSIYETQDFRFF
ncbi:MAG: terminase large subunit [Aeromonas sp.]